MAHQLRQTPAPPALPTTNDEGPSMSATLLAPLNELQALAHTLFLSLSPPQSKPPPPPSISSFVECDKALASAINLAYVHQNKQRQIDALEAEILNLDAQWREICAELATGKAELEELIEEGDVRIKAIDEAKKGAEYFWRGGSARGLTCRLSFYTIPRTPGICPKSQRIHLCTAEYARPCASWSTTPSAVFPAISQRREDAPRTTQCGSTPRSIGRNTFRWKT